MIRPLVPSLDPVYLYDLGGEGVAGALKNLKPDWTQISLSRVFSGNATRASDSSDYDFDFEFSEVWTPAQEILRAYEVHGAFPSNKFAITTAAGYPFSPRVADNGYGFVAMGDASGSASFTALGTLGGAPLDEQWSMDDVTGGFSLDAPPVRPNGLQVRANVEFWQLAGSSWTVDVGTGVGIFVEPESWDGVRAAGPYPLVDWALLLRGGTFQRVTSGINETVGDWVYTGTLTWKLVLS